MRLILSDALASQDVTWSFSRVSLVFRLFYICYVLHLKKACRFGWFFKEFPFSKLFKRRREKASIL